MKTNTEAIQFLRALVSNVGSGILTFDMNGIITMVNIKALHYLDIQGSVNDILDKYVLDLIRIDELSEEIKNCLNNSRKDFHLGNILHNERYLIIDGKELFDGMLLNITDITSDVLIKDKATRMLLLGQEQERRRLAKEIHDGIGPNMSTLKLYIDAVKRKLKDDTIIAELEKINDEISEIASEIRQISHALMPSSLIDFGVDTALKNFINKIADTGKVKIEYSSDIYDGYLTKEYELNIYRIIQELVNNSIKHSGCEKITITIQTEEDKLQINVNDDGKGMDFEKKSAGIGLENVNSRVESLQGSISHDSDEGNGLHVSIILPLVMKEIKNESSYS